MYIIRACSSFKKIQDGYLVLFLLLLGPAIVVPTSNQDGKDCGSISTDECMEKLQTFLKLKSLPFTTKEPELNKLCSDTVAGYNCSSTKMSVPNCASPKEKDLIQVFIEMAQFTMFMFCVSEDGHNGYLREAMLKNSECIMQEKENLDCCADQSNLMDFPVMHFLDQSSKSMAERQMATCCPVATYIKCAQTVISDNCGEMAGNFTAEYIRRSSGEQLESVCQKIPGYPEPNQDICKTSPPVCPGSGSGMIVETTVLMCLLLAIWLNYA